MCSKFLIFLSTALLQARAEFENPLYDEESGMFHHGCFLELLLGEIAKAFEQLDRDDKLPPGIEIGIHNKDFIPCWNCKSYRETLNLYNPITHCLNCIPVVTHTKQGICVLVNGNGKTLIMDLIPVLPSPQNEWIESLMELYSCITTSLLEEKPPGWKKAFMAYFTKDKVIPEEMQELSQIATQDVQKRYILVKLLNYGPEPNYQIRATQSVDAISKLTAVEADCLTYQYVKTLIKLLGIENVGSYLIKKLFLTHTNFMKDQAAAAAKGVHERTNLFVVLSSSELAHFFSNRIKLDLDSIVDEGIIPLIPQTDSKEFLIGNCVKAE